MIKRKMSELKKILAEMAPQKSMHRKWIKDYPLRPGVDFQYLSQHLAAGQALAGSALTALFLTDDTQMVRSILYNRDEGSESSRNFPYYYAHLLLADLLAAWNKDALFGKKEYLQDQSLADNIYDFLDALACCNDRVAKKLSFYHLDDADALFGSP